MYFLTVEGIICHLYIYPTLVLQAELPEVVERAVSSGSHGQFLSQSSVDKDLPLGVNYLGCVEVSALRHVGVIGRIDGHLQTET